MKETPNGTRWAEIAEDAASTGDLPGACARGGVTLAELTRTRGLDPVIDGYFSAVDHCLRLTAAAAVTAQAAAGDLRAIRAITDGTVDCLQQRPRTGPGSIPEHVAAAMLAAGLRALQAGPTEDEAHFTTRCPRCSGWLSVRVTSVLGPAELTITPAVEAQPL